MLQMTRVSYVYAQIMHLMRWSLVRVQVATLLKMMFDYTLALYGPLLTFLCIMSLIEIILMHEIGNLAISDSEMRNVMF